jgi:hypothetical protein
VTVKGQRLVISSSSLQMGECKDDPSPSSDFVLEDDGALDGAGVWQVLVLKRLWYHGKCWCIGTNWCSGMYGSYGACWH